MGQDVYSAVNLQMMGLLNEHGTQVHYRIAGGEPLLVFDEWSALLDAFRMWRTPQCSATVLTALGLDMPQAFKDMFSRGDIGISTSLDGITMSKPYHNGGSSAGKAAGNIGR